MDKIILLIIVMSVDVTFATINCTTNVCSWFAWGEWGKCTESHFVGNLGTQKRDRRACCPEDLKEKTIEECIKECAITHPGNMNISDAFESKKCVMPTTTTTTTSTTTQPPTTAKLQATTHSRKTTQPTTIAIVASKATTMEMTRLQTSKPLKATTQQRPIPTSKMMTTGISSTFNRLLSSKRKTTDLTTHHPPIAGRQTKGTSTVQNGRSTSASKHQAGRTDTKPDDSGGSAVPAAIGSTLGVLSLAGLSSCLGYLFWKRNKKNKEEKKVHPVTEESANGTPPAEHGI